MLGFKSFISEIIKIRDELLGIKTDREDISFEQAVTYYNTSVRLKRADDAEISFFINHYQEAGGSHGHEDYYARNFDVRKGELLELEDIILDTDVKTFYGRMADLMKESYEESMDVGEMEFLERAVQRENWYLSGYGIHFFAVRSNSAGTYSYAAPYERIVNHIKPEYLSVSKEAEIYISEEKPLQIDVNGDGELDWIMYSGGKVVINGVSFVLEEDVVDLTEKESCLMMGF